MCCHQHFICSIARRGLGPPVRAYALTLAWSCDRPRAAYVTHRTNYSRWSGGCIYPQRKNPGELKLKAVLSTGAYTLRGKVRVDLNSTASYIPHRANLLSHGSHLRTSIEDTGSLVFHAMRIVGIASSPNTRRHSMCEVVSFRKDRNICRSLRKSHPG